MRPGPDPCYPCNPCSYLRFMFISSPSDLSGAPKKIISLVPSETELLFTLGLNEETIGITKFCVHPTEWFRTKTRIGGTKSVHIDKIRELRPDLVLANKEENVKDQIDELAETFPVHVSDVKNFDEGLSLIEQIGRFTGKITEAASVSEKIRRSFSQLKTPNTKPRTAYLIWRDPYMTIGGDTFISDMMSRAGLDNIFKEQDRYPVFSIKELQQKNPELILLSSEPFPFKEKHIRELQPYFPGTKLLLADGEMFSWYGSRMQYAAEYFQKMLNPE